MQELAGLASTLHGITIYYFLGYLHVLTLIDIDSKLLSKFCAIDKYSEIYLATLLTCLKDCLQNI
jgi:hypothetical protein